MKSSSLRSHFIQEVLWSILGSYSAIWSLPLTNVWWHSDPWPVTVTSKPIRLSTNFMTLIPGLTFTELRVVFMEHLQRGGMPAGNAYPLGHLVPSHFWELAYAPMVETSFTELAIFFLDFLPWILFGTFWIFLKQWCTLILLRMPTHNVSMDI